MVQINVVFTGIFCLFVDTLYIPEEKNNFFPNHIRFHLVRPYILLNIIGHGVYLIPVYGLPLLIVDYDPDHKLIMFCFIIQPYNYNT
jgi:hypothetical protein